MSVEQAFIEFMMPNNEGRDKRLERNQRDFNLTRASAEILDESMVECIRACIATLGRRIDNMGRANGLRGAALKLFPEIVYRNLEVMADFVQSVDLLTTLEGQPITAPNPDNPTCECASCKAVRELSIEMVIRGGTH